jgi:AraC family transcriptional regulator
MYSLTDVKIEELSAISTLATRHLGDYQTIGIAFERLMVWAAGKGLLETPMQTFALYYDDPISKPKQDLISDACLCLPASIDIQAIANGDVKALTIASSRCATFIFKGPYSDLDKPYRWLYDTWLPQSGAEVGNNPPFEEYLNDARSTPPSELITKICIPLIQP